MSAQSGGTQSGADLDAWLRQAGVVVASSDRAARALQAGFHRRRREEGLSAWPLPAINDWGVFASNAWQEMARDSRLLLNPAQEQQIWSEIIHSDKHLPTTLPASVRRLAAMAMNAHNLLCSYAPRYLEERARAGWDQDTGAFSQWLAEFDRHCWKNQLISRSRVPQELVSILQKETSVRTSLRIAGFDRILPVQQALFDAWGKWQRTETADGSGQASFFSVRDGQSELEACAWWCDQQLQAKPDTRLLIITQDLAQRRGEIERAFLRFHPPGTAPLFELSLGVPLNDVPLARSALLFLRWLSGSLGENELDWLFASGYAGSPDECVALQACMRRLRYRDRQRIEWTLDSLLKEMSGSAPAQWVRRLREAQLSLKGLDRHQNPVDWADAVPRTLEAIGWPGTLTQSSADFQALRRWQYALDTAGSLGFSGRRIAWHDFLNELETAAAEILFTPESTDAPIQIVGPAESAGLSADAIWFLGADEDTWPAAAPMHPFLPPHVQREAAMPHSSHVLDWEFSAAITHRLISSAPAVNFSFAEQKDDMETRPSRLIKQIAGTEQSLFANLFPPLYEPPLSIEYHDSTRIPFRLGNVKGGAGVLSSQSQCPFKAFAGARLAAESWDFAEAGLSAKQRGQILHEVLHSVWSGKRPGIRTHRELMDIKDLAAFVRTHVKAVFRSALPPGIEEQMPKMYLELEETRLIRLVAEWLDFERGRLVFTVEETEAQRPVTIAGLSMNLRLDRVDRLHDGSQLIIDYKTGNVDSKSWDVPRPEDVQLPLYKLFGLDPLQPSLFESYGGPVSGGLVFGKVRIGKPEFTGRVANAKETLLPSLSANSSLVKRKLTAQEESDWKDAIERLVKDFLHGQAEVDPRDYPKTCERCGRQSVCRIQEPANRARFEERDTEDDDDIEE
ncbi:MAG TPA: PD-(D/E)XK nuclease family protein [Terracidiphilus sp.]|jgi:probable DNA repair protein